MCKSILYKCEKVDINNAFAYNYDQLNQIDQQDLSINHSYENISNNEIWIEPYPIISFMVPTLIAKDQETTKESLSSSLSKTIIPHESNPHVPIFSIWPSPLCVTQ
ncbi:unnamed protein product [Rhizophagus irregularis]|nr:unnamed protein product [Rhizophagus irregularis]